MDLQEVGCGLDEASSGYGQLTVTSKCVNKPSGSIKYADFLDLFYRSLMVIQPAWVCFYKRNVPRLTHYTEVLTPDRHTN